MFGFGKATPRGSATQSDMPTISQCLMLDPIVIGDKNKTHSVELRRVLGLSVGSSSEDNSFGAVYPKNLSPLAVEELKQLITNVSEILVLKQAESQNNGVPRSVGAVFSRSIDSDVEVKRHVHHKLTSDSSLQASDSNIGFMSVIFGMLILPIIGPALVFSCDSSLAVLILITVYSDIGTSPRELQKEHMF